MPQSEKAVILREKDASGNFYLIVRTSNLFNIDYNFDGLVDEFTAKDPKTNRMKRYIFLDHKRLTKGDASEDSRNTIPGGFYERDIFHQYHKDSHDTLRDMYIIDVLKTRFTKFIEAQSGDTIDYKRLLVAPDQTSGLYESSPSHEFHKEEIFELFYNDEVIGNDDFGRPAVFDILNQIHPVKSIPLAPNSLGVTFYENNIMYANDLGLTAAERYRRAMAIIKTAVYIDHIDNTIFPLFPDDTIVQVLIQNQRTAWTTSNGEFFTARTTEEILGYLSSIREFNHRTISDYLIIKEAEGINSIWRLLGALTPFAMDAIDLKNRIRFLEIIAGYRKLDETNYGNMKFDEIDFETIVRNLVLSVTPIDADVFLDALLTIPPGLTEITLFQYIFDETNDTGYSLDALKYIMNHLCSLWMESKYSFYGNGIPTPTFPNELGGTEPSLSEVLSYMNDDQTQYNDSQVTPELYSKSPLTFEYTSKSVAWLFHDTSHDFTFSGAYLIAKKDIPYITEPIYTEAKVYHLYQGVNIAISDDTPDDLKMQFPQFTINGKKALLSRFSI